MERLSYSELLKLKRWNTPTIYNGWEMITKLERTQGGFNRMPCNDYMPQMGPMVGYAVTLEVEPSNPAHQTGNPNALKEFIEFVNSIEGPKILVVKDRDKQHIGSFWGEVGANLYKRLGCVGTITDGSIRDVDEMTNAGFKAIAKQMCVGHAYSTPAKWGGEVEVFDCKIKTGDLIHADKHGFLVIEPDVQQNLIDSVIFMDNNECNNLLNISRNSLELSDEEFIATYLEGVGNFKKQCMEFKEGGNK